MVWLNLSPCFAAWDVARVRGKVESESDLNEGKNKGDIFYPLSCFFSTKEWTKAVQTFQYTNLFLSPGKHGYCCESVTINGSVLCVWSTNAYISSVGLRYQEKVLLKCPLELGDTTSSWRHVTSMCV